MSESGAGQDGLFAELSERLRVAQQLLRSLAADSETKSALAQRLISITNSAKHDLRTASERLDALMPELESPEEPAV